VVGLGALGARAARRLAGVTTVATVELEDWGELEELDGPSDEGAPGNDLTHERATNGADAIREAMAPLLEHRSVMARSHGGPTDLPVLLLGSLAEPGVRAALPPLLGAIDRMLSEQLGPLVSGRSAGAHVALLPILILPRAETPDRRSHHAIDTLRSIAKYARRPGTPIESIARVLVIEDIGARSVLGEDEQVSLLRNAALFIAEARTSPETASLTDPLLRHDRGAPPLGTLAVATAELPRARLGQWARAHVGVELLDAVLEARVPAASTASADAIESIDLDSLDQGRDALHLVREALLERYLPTITPDAPPRVLERAQTLRERWGPDHADASVGDPVVAPEIPVGFALKWTRTIEEAWVRFQRTRFDDLVATERARLEEARITVSSRAKERIDAELVASAGTTPGADALRRAQATTDLLRRAVGERQRDAIRERDAMRPHAPPSFLRFHDAHARFLDSLRARADVDRTVLFGVLLWCAVVLLGPTLLAALADALAIDPSGDLSHWLRDDGTLTSAIAGLVIIGGSLGITIHAAHTASIEAHAQMWKVLGETIDSVESTSVLSYFASRLRLAREAARAEALLSVRGALDRDADRLRLADRAAKRTRSELASRVLSSSSGPGVAQAAPRRREDLARAAERALRGEPLALETTLVGAGAGEAIARLLPAAARDTRIADVLRRLSENERWSSRWREEVPFASIDALERATAPHAEPVAAWDPMEGADAAEASFDAIAAFIRQHAESLRAPLATRERGVGARPFGEGKAFVPLAAVGAVRARLDSGAAGRSIGCERGPGRDRAFYVVAELDLSENDLLALSADPERPA
jgi:hypothetical protein